MLSLSHGVHTEAVKSHGNLPEIRLLQEEVAQEEESTRHRCHVVPLV